MVLAGVASAVLAVGLGSLVPGASAAAPGAAPEPPTPAPAVYPTPQGAVRWAADLARPDSVAAGFTTNSANRQLGDGAMGNPALPWPVRTVAAPGGRPGNALRFTLPNDAIRYEVEPNHRSFVEGDDAWFGFSFYLGRGFPLGTRAFQVIEQLHGAPSTGSPPVGFQVAENALVLEGGNAKPGATPANRFAYRQRLAPLTTERWYDVVYHVHFSQSALLSVVDVWLDGRPVVANFHPPGGTVYPGRSEHHVGTYRKEGLYHDRSVPGGTVYLANQRLGSSYADAYPRLRGR